MFTKESFGQRLRALRKSRGEKQEELGAVIGVSKTQISEMEAGKKTTTIEKLALLCVHYQVSADYLLGFREEAEENEQGRPPCVRPPSLPPTGGKVAFAKQMTDEGAEGRTVHYPRGHPHQSRFARQLPPRRGKPLWGTPMCAPCPPLR